MAQQPQGLSLLDRPLIPAQPSGETRRRLDAAVIEARAAYDKDPRSVEALLELGRRTAAAGRFGEAIEIWTRGVEAHTDEPRFYRLRAQWYITIRKFDPAVRDLTKAAQLLEGKPDQPDADPPHDPGTDNGSLKSNINYELGLAQYLKGAFAEAADAFRRCVAPSQDPDSLVTAANWLYMALRRLKKTDEAHRLAISIPPGLQVVRNQSAYRLLLAYKDGTPLDTLINEKRPPVSYPPKPADENADREMLTLAYGAANAQVYSARADDAKRALRHVVDKYADQWMAVPYIAAEADLARILKARRR